MKTPQNGIVEQSDVGLHVDQQRPNAGSVVAAIPGAQLHHNAVTLQHLMIGLQVVRREIVPTPTLHDGWRAQPKWTLELAVVLHDLQLAGVLHVALHALGEVNVFDLILLVDRALHPPNHLANEVTTQQPRGLHLAHLTLVLDLQGHRQQRTSILDADLAVAAQVAIQLLLQHALLRFTNGERHLQLSCLSFALQVLQHEINLIVVVVVLGGLLEEGDLLSHYAGHEFELLCDTQLGQNHESFT